MGQIENEKLVGIENDDQLPISTGKSRFETAWKNKTIFWSALLLKLSRSVETPETHAEYMKMSKEQQDRIKDIGGFVGGHLKEGRRKTGCVLARQILTLDADFPPPDFWDELMHNLELGNAMAVYSTHKHSAKTPRYRLIMPLDREVTPDEYEAIARKIAKKISIDYFDDSTFQPSRLMYWPSHSSDVEPFFQYYDAPFLSADRILREYKDWTDTSYWPMSSRMSEDIRKRADKQGNPLEKKGPVGLFCRTYTVTEAIEKFLPGIYLKTGKDDRYTYALGSTAAGLVIYDSDEFAYSNHSTDPAGGQLCNAFDLVRIHLFGDQDDEAKPGTPVNRLPSYTAMVSFASSDPDYAVERRKERAAEAAEAFGAEPQEDDSEAWEVKLSVSQQGVLMAIPKNLMLIFHNDADFSGFARDEFSDRIRVTGPVPWTRPGYNPYWRDADGSAMRVNLSIKYTSFLKRDIDDCFATIAEERRFHPVRDYLDGIRGTWDGTERLDTLLIDYFGAEDSEYVRAVTRKTLMAAVARIYKPGTKFDNMLVLNGPQGAGKSTFFARLAHGWSTDALNFELMRDDKKAGEILQGVWIAEIGELSGIRKAEVESVKQFISATEDRYRKAFGTVAESHPRQCIFVGTTNSQDGFLMDSTGNRRFWPVQADDSAGAELRAAEKVFGMTDADVRQIWAEAIVRYDTGEELRLDSHLIEEAVKAQTAALAADGREDLVNDFLEMLLPETWEEMSIDERRRYFADRTMEGGGLNAAGTKVRQQVTTAEIWCECLNKSLADARRADWIALGKILMRLGWEKHGHFASVQVYGKTRRWLYERKNMNTNLDDF